MFRILMIIAALALAASVVIVNWPAERETPPAPVPETRLSRQLAEFTSALRPDDPYRPPTETERQAITRGIMLLLRDGLGSGLAQIYLAPLGFSLQQAVDEATSRPYLSVVNERNSERAWGMYLVDLSVQTRLVIEVPHPNSDLRTEEMGLALFRQVPGAVLMVAGAHRDAADKAADVAHRTDSAFHAVAAELAARDLPQVQLHGFHDSSLPTQDVVLSVGAGRPDDIDIMDNSVQSMQKAGLTVCRAWLVKCGRLAGTSNRQGQMAAEFGAPYMHVEVSRSVREDGWRRSAVVDAIADAVIRER